VISNRKDSKTMCTICVDSGKMSETTATEPTSPLADAIPVVPPPNLRFVMYELEEPDAFRAAQQNEETVRNHCYM
jgi:hypothetical protein